MMKHRIPLRVAGRIQRQLEQLARSTEDQCFPYIQRILDEMQDLGIVRQMDDTEDKIVENATGNSIAHTEFLADTLDRCGEELVGPG